MGGEVKAGDVELGRVACRDCGAGSGCGARQSVSRIVQRALYCGGQALRFGGGQCRHGCRRAVAKSIGGLCGSYCVDVCFASSGCRWGVRQSFAFWFVGFESWYSVFCCAFLFWYEFCYWLSEFARTKNFQEGSTMLQKDFDRDWDFLSEEVLTGMREWRIAHPKATFVEIETALDERLNRLRARMLSDSAQASAATDWTGRPEGERPHCPECGGLLVSRGPRIRRLQRRGGAEGPPSSAPGQMPP